MNSTETMYFNQRSEKIDLIAGYMEKRDHMLNEEQLMHLAMVSIDIGCLKIARGALAILLSLVKDEDREEEICESLSTIHNAKISNTVDITHQIWERNINSYDDNELEELIEALLVNEQAYLAQAICTTREHLPIRLIADIEAGRLEFDIDQSSEGSSKQPWSTNILKAFANEHRPLLSDISQNNKLISRTLKAINSEQVFFNAHLIPKQLLIPIGAYNFETNEYNYDHPCMDAPSLLWEKNMPESDQWIKSIHEAQALLESRSTTERNFQNTWKNWPNSINYPNSIACRIGIANTLDHLWHSQIKSNNSLFIIEDYCPSRLIAQFLEMASGKKDVDNDNLIKFATDTSYLISILPKKDIIDLSCYNLLNLTTTLMLPEPIHYILIDLEPKQLRKSVLGSDHSTCPDPIPFVFENHTLENICQLWHGVNQTIKKIVSKNRIIIINEEKLSQMAEGKTIANNDDCPENLLTGISAKQADIILKTIN